MTDLRDYVIKHSTRGACMCGKCVDGPPTPDLDQPAGHTVDVHFFKVALANKPDSDTFRTLVKEYIPEGASELSYITLGGQVGDQGFALQIMGMGDLLGVWDLLTPKKMIPGLDDETAGMMAGAGMVAIMERGRGNST